MTEGQWIKIDNICRKVGNMDIQAILPQINNAVNLSSNGIKCGDEFEKLLQQVSEETDIAGRNFWTKSLM